VKSRSYLFLFILFLASSCYGQSNLPVAKKDSLFHAGLNMILEDMPNDFKKFRGKEFFENNGIYYQRFAASYSLPFAANSYITAKYNMTDSMQFTFHSCWNYPLKDSLVIREKADSMGRLITGCEYKCCQTMRTKDYSNKNNYFRFFYTDGKKDGMPDAYENVYMEITIRKDYIKKGVQGFVVHLEIREEELPKGSE
jgi:hypothetical protein